MTKLRITKCDVQKNGQVKPLTGRSDYFETSINPSSYKTALSISYSGAEASEPKPLGVSGATPRYKFTNAEDLSFEIILDATGVVPDAKDLTVAGQLAALKKIAYDYDGKKHEPNVVKISWGKGGMEPFFGRLCSLGIDYTLFRPTGEALRAKLALGFKSFATIEEITRNANKSSPDLSHHVIVVAGDTLPLLCQRIYQDPGKYLEVAQRNGLDGFRALEPGTELIFPPMR